MNPFFLYMSQCFFFFWKKKTQRIQLFFFNTTLRNWSFFDMTQKIFKIWLRTFYIFSKKKMTQKKWFFFESYPKNWTLFTMTLRIEPIFPEWDSENWTPLMWLKDVVLCIWLEKLNFLEYDTKIWTFFLNVIQSIFQKN